MQNLVNLGTLGAAQTKHLTAVEATKERVFVAEVNHIAGNIALMLPERDEVKAVDYFERALSVARQQQAKS